MSDLTAEAIADFLAAADNTLADELDAKVGLYATGHTLHIEVTPRQSSNAVRFAARVFPVEPAPPVAAEPVRLDAETARELTYLEPGDDYEGWTLVLIKEQGSTRWASSHSIVIRNEAGEHFASHFRTGLTEQQETRPWEGLKVALFKPVARRTRVVQVHDWVAPAENADAAPAAS
ncbi:hypothetical protein [Nonomuraea sp. JJY05]|uniref:hypothetical protein n=1 Tax=Nonomuraea sp. JJY05 TaxID=3350255 RepID=UPI00373F93A9